MICSCGKKKDKRAKACKDCTPQVFKINWPDKEELERMVLEMSRLEIGRRLGVSDNAVKKRCIALGIQMPYNKGRGYWAKKEAGKI